MQCTKSLSLEGHPADPTQSFFFTHYTFTNGTPLYGNISITAATPEPNSIFLVGSGLAGLGGLLRRKLRA